VQAAHAALIAIMVATTATAKQRFRNFIGVFPSFVASRAYAISTWGKRFQRGEKNKARIILLFKSRDKEKAMASLNSEPKTKPYGQALFEQSRAPTPIEPFQAVCYEQG